MKILVRLPNWLGDVVMSTGFIQAVKQQYPEALIGVIVKDSLSSIAALIPGIHAVHSFSKAENSGLMGVYRYGKRFRPGKYDLFFNLPSSLSSAVLARATNAVRRIGFNTEGGVFLYTNAYSRPKNVHRVDEYISLLERYTGIAVSRKSVGLNVNKAVTRDPKRLLVNFNSEASSRRMPVQKAISLVNNISLSFPDVKLCFVGSNKETDFVKQIINGIDKPTVIENFAGRTNLAELCQLMASSAAVLTTDSGPAHLANSIGIPTVVLFGAGNELNTAPYNPEGLTVLRHGKLSCEPCVRNTCKLYGIPKCMELLNELHIIESLSLYLTHA